MIVGNKDKTLLLAWWKSKKTNILNKNKMKMKKVYMFYFDGDSGTSWLSRNLVSRMSSNVESSVFSSLQYLPILLFTKLTKILKTRSHVIGARSILWLQLRLAFSQRVHSTVLCDDAKRSARTKQISRARKNELTNESATSLTLGFI